MTSERFEVQRPIAAPPATIFALLVRPERARGDRQLRDAAVRDGDPVRRVGDSSSCTWIGRR